MPKSAADFGFRNVPMIERLEGRQLLSADLVGSFAGAIPQDLEPAASNHIVVRLSNTGNARAAGQATVNLYASTDSTLDATDTLLASASPRVNLAPNASQSLSFKFVAPTTFADGNDFLLLKVDSSAIAGAAPAINVAATPAPVMVHAAVTDLAISFAKLPSHPIELDGYSSGHGKAVVAVTNVGNVAVSGNVTVNLYLSSDATLDATDPILSTIANAAVKLRPGATKTFSLEIVPPPGTAVGGYFLFATLTPGSSINDSNAANNVAMSSRRVAVVDQLPQPTIVNISQDSDTTVFSDGAICAVTDDTTVVQTGGDTSDNSNATQPATQDSTQDNSSSDDDSSTDTSQPAPTDTTTAPSDSSSSTDDSSSDSWDDSSDSDGGSF